MADQPLIRPFKVEDLPVVRKIAFETAAEQSRLASLISDPDFISETLVAGYAALDPSSFFVAEMDGRIVGYLTGCVDTDAFNRRYMIRIFPSLAVQFFTRGIFKRMNVLASFAQAAWKSLLNAGKRTRAVKGYPAHCHINLLNSHRHFGLGALLMDRFFDHLRIHQVPGVHLATSTDVGKKFFLKYGFETLLVVPSPDVAENSPKELWIMVKKI